jgi:hypothetical protein
VQAKEAGKVELKIILTQNLGDGVGSIIEWMNLPMRPCKALFLQVLEKDLPHLVQSCREGLIPFP